MSSPTKLQRWLDVVAYLAGRRLPVATEDLWKAVPAYRPGLEGTDGEKQKVRRMFERDKDELRDLGIPIETVSYSINYGLEHVTGYRLETRDFHLPYLRLVADARAADTEDGTERGGRPATDPAGAFALDRGEAGAALEGLSELAEIPSFPLRGAARSGLRKLTFDLDPDTLREAPVVYATDPETEAARDTLRALSSAVQSRKRVSFLYRAITREAEAWRRAHPYGLLFQHGRWYMVGWDVDREAERMFRVGRMSEVRPDRQGGGPDYEVPAAFDLNAYAGRSAWEVGEDPEGSVGALVRFRFPRSLWAERNDHGQLVAEQEDGSQLRRFPILRRDPFLRWILSLGGDAWIESPEALRDAFGSLATEVATRYGYGGDDTDA
ncbi:MAG: WYL domain-containing protein [Gemmatimonadota bacterium]|nr:WYL domain-containing protein [Gemmatimonadota bacterium]